MRDEDLEWLVRQLIGTAELLGQQMTPTAAALMAEDLSAYTVPVLAAALRRVRAEHSGRLTLRTILDRVDEASGRLAPNEAWAVACQAQDERQTVVWTNEMAQAWEAAATLAQAGDMVGARMAFIAAYERIVRAARDERAVPQVLVSLGWDADLRVVALERAQRIGQIAAEQAAEHALPALPEPAFNPVALLTGRVEETSDCPPDVRERLARLRADLASRRAVDAAARAARREREARDWLERKAQAQRLVDERMAAQEHKEGA